MDREILYSIIEEISERPKSDSTRIYHDLFISGDDAYELFEEIHKKFGTNFYSLDFGEYFPDESESLIWGLLMRLGIKCKKKEMTVGHLLEVIRRKEWFDP